MASVAEVFVTVLPSEQVDITSFYKNVLRPALAAVGPPASRPATTAPDGARVPAIRGVRLHDLRLTFATMQLSAGVHFMQVSKWLGRSSDVLTLSTYADYIPEQGREPAARTGGAGAKKKRGKPAPLDGGLDMAACRRSRTIRHPRTTAPSATESDGMALVAKPVQITGKGT